MREFVGNGEVVIVVVAVATDERMERVRNRRWWVWKGILNGLRVQS